MTDITQASLFGALFGAALSLSGIATLYIGVTFVRIALFRFMGWEI